MRTVIAGGHGQVGRRLARTLVERGDDVVAFVRSAAHITDLTELGAHVALVDLEQDDAVAVSFELEGADAVVFTAGAGPGSGAERKDTVDRAGAEILADAAERAGVGRYVLVSSRGVEAAHTGRRPDDVDDVFWAYLQAKAAAENDLRRRSGLQWTVVRPGRLTDEPGVGLVALAPVDDEGQRPRGKRRKAGGEREEISRDDVALVVAALLHEPRSAGMVLELVGGNRPVDEALGDVFA
ncbi:SDR family oxidoreductase [Cellulosimicrobium cellulans]|uniref:SDR family oxidoreductase n=1 Tax=Cellulosimicrobium cellulans TaxID=1710 RepID=UPI0008488C86|nr:SDR family oxidoreductase [Cellulosimicrobium cellulans]